MDSGFAYRIYRGFTCLSVCTITLLAGFAAHADPPERPNIIFIMADDHAAHAVSAYQGRFGNAVHARINETPNIDRLASEGMLFTNAFCTNSICGPARATLLTGKYSHKNNYKKNDMRFDTSQQTFPKLLKLAGYQTAIVGKLHLLCDAVEAGFDLDKTLYWQGTYFDPLIAEETIYGYTTDIITDEAIAWLQNGRDESKPFYLSIHHKAPHRNWESDDAHAGMFLDEDLPLPITFDDDYSSRSSAAKLARMTIEQDLNEADYKLEIPPDLTPQQVKEFKHQGWLKDYLRTIASIDDNLGHLLTYLETSGLAANTMVIYTSDQGFFLGDHGWFDKRFMYEESLRFPLIVRYPQVIDQGAVNSQMVLNVDFAPTFLEYAGVEIPADMQGQSFRPLLEGESPPDWRTSMYYRYYEELGPPLAHAVKRHYGIRTERYKLIYFDTISQWELFDLQEDPHELNNEINDPAYASVVDDLKNQMEQLRADLEDDDDDGAVWGCTPALASTGGPGRRNAVSGVTEVLIILTAPLLVILLRRKIRRKRS